MKTPETQTDVFDPAALVEHPWADDFRDIPLKWRRVPDGKGALVFQPDGPGVLATPIAPTAFARHVQLLGYRPIPEERKIRRVDPVRGGRSLTSPGIWQDISAPMPVGDPVHAVVATAAASGMTPAELMKASERLAQAARDQV